MKIENFENYEVRPNGDVINTKTGKVLKPFKDKKGYLMVTLCNNGCCKTFKVHRLVAQAFIPNPENLPCVNHKDEDKSNNNVENLEWCTAEYNNNYGTRNKRSAESRSKIVLQLRENDSLVRVWPSVNEVKRQLGYSVGNIVKCCNGKRHIAYNYKWCYTY